MPERQYSLRLEYPIKANSFMSSFLDMHSA